MKLTFHGRGAFLQLLGSDSAGIVDVLLDGQPYDMGRDLWHAATSWEYVPLQIWSGGSNSTLPFADRPSEEHEVVIRLNAAVNPAAVPASASSPRLALLRAEVF